MPGKTKAVRRYINLPARRAPLPFSDAGAFFRIVANPDLLFADSWSCDNNGDRNPSLVGIRHNFVS